MIKSVFLLLFLNLLIKPIWLLVIDRGVQNQVGTEAYGKYYIAFTLAMYLQVLLDPGIHTFINRYLSRHSHKVGWFLTHTLGLKVLLSLLYILGTLILIYVSDYENDIFYLSIGTMLNMSLLSLTLYFRSYLTALHKFSHEAVYSIIDRVLMILIIGMSFLFMKDYISTRFFVISQTISYSISLVIISFTVFRYANFEIKIRFNKRKMYPIIKSGLPYALLGFLIVLYSKSDLYILDYFHKNSSFEAGIYAAAQRLIEAGSMITLLIASIILPVFSKRIHQKEDLSFIHHQIVKVVFIPFTLLISVLYFYSGFITKLLYQENKEYIELILKQISLSFLGISLVYIYGTILTAGGKIKILLVSSISVLILNVIFNLIFTPIYGADSMSMISSSTHLLIGIVQAFFAIRIYGLSISNHNILKYFIIIVLLISFFFFISKFVKSAILGIIIIGGISCIFAFGFKIFSVKDITALIQLKNDRAE